MSGKKSYRPWAPEQSFLLPPSPLEWLPQGHLAYFILDLIKELDLSKIEEQIQKKDPRGNRPYSPLMMVGLLLYAYCVGVYSSRKIERATYEDVAFRVIAGGQHPHFTVINAFRKAHLEELKALFTQVLKLCQKAGLVKLGQVAFDGTKIQANASKHKAMSYERMQELEKKLEKEIEQLLERAEKVDQEEDHRWGEGHREEDIPKELHRREARLERITQAKAALEAEAQQARARTLREQAERSRQRAAEAETPAKRKINEGLAQRQDEQAAELEAKASDDAPPPMPEKTSSGLPTHRLRTKKDATPHPKAQRNFTDPDSRIMESGGSFLQGYNCQAAVDEDHQIILAHGLSNQCPDNANLLPMLKQVQKNCDDVPQNSTADAGYWEPTVPQRCDELGTNPLISTYRRKHWEAEDTTEGDPPPESSPREAMRWKLRTDEGRKIYARRKVTVEPVFGQIKEARGFRRFLLRGLPAVEAEWGLVCLAHNLLKLFRYAPADAAA